MESVKTISKNTHLQDDPVKDEAQKMADDLTTLQGLLENLQKDPTLADQSLFWTQFYTSITQVSTEYTYLLVSGVIPTSDLDPMFNKFNNDVLLLKDMPSSTKTLVTICQEARMGDTTDLHQFLDKLVQEPSVIALIEQDTQTAQGKFQAYANNH